MWWLWLIVIFFFGLVLGVFLGRSLTLLVVKEVVKDKMTESYNQGWDDGQKSLFNQAYAELGINELENWINDE